MAAGAVSLSSIATGLARTLVGDTAGGRALVVGATRTARGLGARLLADGWAVTSAPSVRTGPALAPLLDSFDVVASASGTRARTLPVDAMVDAAAAHRDRPLLVLDLSVPRDVDPAARDLDGVLLYDIDDLGAAGDHALEARRAGVPGAQAIVEQELDRFEAWRATRSLIPTIKALRAHVRRTAIDALGDTLGPRHDGDAEVEQAVERLVTHLLHAPTRRLRAAAAAGVGDRYAGLARDLFGVREDAGEETPPPSVSGPLPGTRIPARSLPDRARSTAPPAPIPPPRRARAVSGPQAGRWPSRDHPGRSPLARQAVAIEGRAAPVDPHEHDQLPSRRLPPCDPDAPRHGSRQALPRRAGLPARGRRHLALLHTAGQGRGGQIALAAVAVLTDDLVDAERWSPDRAQRLLDDIWACGPWGVEDLSIAA